MCGGWGEWRWIACQGFCRPANQRLVSDPPSLPLHNIKDGHPPANRPTLPSPPHLTPRTIIQHIPPRQRLQQSQLQKQLSPRPTILIDYPHIRHIKKRVTAVETVLMLAGIRPDQVSGSGCALEFTGGELLPLFDDGDGFQAPTIVDSPMALGAMAIPSNGSGPLASTVNPSYLLIPPSTPPTLSQNHLMRNFYNILTLHTTPTKDKHP